MVEQVEQVEHDTNAFQENCEQCGHLMPEGCIGWCAECPSEDDHLTGREEAFADFYAWGGWQRASGEYTDEEWAARKGRTTCGRQTTSYQL